jgi:sortase B
VRRIFSSKSKLERKSNAAAGTETASYEVTGKVRTRKYLLHICVVTVFVLLIAWGLYTVFIVRSEESAARSEYDHLRELFTSTPEPSEPAAPQHENDEDDPEIEPDDDEDIYSYLDYDSQLLDLLAEINPDFIGWISIENVIDYPVVRGRDNYKYINTTFSGERNRAGAIFMDNRNRNGFDDHVVILFGHRMRDGTMFSLLLNYQNRSFMQENPIITITTRDGEVLTYRIFAARQTDAWDAVYNMAFTNSTGAVASFPNAPADASRFLLMSTCTPGSNEEERFIVFAALED